MTKTYIYSLCDPITDKIRYIGKTINPSKRLARHKKDCYKKSSHKECWIYSLLEKGLYPKMYILEECFGDDWIEREKYYIRTISDLTNHTEGGDSPSGHKFSEETKRKMSENRKGEKNSFYNKKHSKESKDIISENIKKYLENNPNPFYDKKHDQESKKIMSIKGKERANKGELPKLPIMIGKDNPSAKERIFISPTKEKYTVFNFKKFCNEKNLSYKIMFRNINKGIIQFPIDKKILDRQREKSLNCVGWEVIL